MRPTGTVGHRLDENPKRHGNHLLTIQDRAEEVGIQQLNALSVHSSCAAESWTEAFVPALYVAAPLAAPTVRSSRTGRMHVPWLVHSDCTCAELICSRGREEKHVRKIGPDRDRTTRGRACAHHREPRMPASPCTTHVGGVARRGRRCSRIQPWMRTSWMVSSWGPSCLNISGLQAIFNTIECGCSLNKVALTSHIRIQPRHSRSA